MKTRVPVAYEEEPLQDGVLLIKPSDFIAGADRELPSLVGGGFAPKNATIAVIAAPGTAKTFFTLDFTLRAVLRWDVFGYASDARGGIYVIAEGQQGFKKRVRAWCLHHGIAIEDLNDRFRFVEVPLDITRPAMVERLVQEIATCGFAVEFIVLDTLSKNAFDGFNESDTADMRKMMAAACRLKDRLGISVIVVHHMGHDGTRYRGSSEFGGTMDTMIYLYKQANGVKVHFEKMRDFDRPPDLFFRLVSAHGSAVIEPIGNEHPAAALLTPFEKLALTVLHEEGGSLKTSLWRYKCEGEDRAKGFKKSKFYDVRKKLAELGLVGIEPKKVDFLTEAGRQHIYNTQPAPASPSDVHGRPQEVHGSWSEFPRRPVLYTGGRGNDPSGVRGQSTEIREPAEDPGYVEALARDIDADQEPAA
jgi:KaiC/GvpD/RAD55 family RecA-like ATPase